MIYKLFTFYHLLFPSTVRSCRFEPTCSQYFLDATKKYGIFKGTVKTILRILSCNPISNRSLIDPA